MNQLSRTKQIIMDWFTIQVHTNFIPKTKGVAAIMEQEAFDELAELERLAEIGRATEKAFEDDNFVLNRYEFGEGTMLKKIRRFSLKELLDWAKED